MKKIVTLVLIAASLFIVNPIYATATYKRWQTINVPNVCTFQIPPTMEIQAGSYKAMMDSLNTDFGWGKNEMVAQQKGLNNMEKAQALYARVIVNANPIDSDSNSLRLGDTLQFSKSDLMEIERILKDVLVEGFRLQKQKTGETIRLVNWRGTKVVSINNIDCVLTTYTRQLENNPIVVVYAYAFFNNTVTNNVTISYREKDKSIWETDLNQKIIKTFNFVKH